MEIQSINTHKKVITITVSRDVLLTSPTYNQTKVTMDATGFNNIELLQILANLTLSKVNEVTEAAVKMQNNIADREKNKR